MASRNVERVLNGLSVAVFIVDADQTITFRNGAAASLFGPGLMGRKLAAVVPNKRCIRAVENVIDGVEQTTVSVTLQLAVPTAFRMTATRLEARKSERDVSVAVSFEDVSHVREAEQMRSDFVANVSHELRSPLTTLGGFIETLQGHARYDPEATTRFLDLMEIEALRMGRLIDDLLSLSKVQSTERYAPTDTVDLCAVIDGVVAALGPVFDAEEARVDLQVDDDLPKVYGDAHELGQVFRNLIENAAKYSRRGTTVRIHLGLDAQEPNLLSVSIADESDGIAQEHISRLTERFYRVDKGRSRDKGGTGLGLAIVKHIVTRHRGRLRIDSTPGQGSVFTVLLPVAREPA